MAKTNIIKWWINPTLGNSLDMSKLDSWLSNSHHHISHDKLSSQKKIKISKTQVSMARFILATSLTSNTLMITCSSSQSNVKKLMTRENMYLLHLVIHKSKMKRGKKKSLKFHLEGRIWLIKGFHLLRQVEAPSPRIKRNHQVIHG
jgi:hypothetical protein